MLQAILLSSLIYWLSFDICVFGGDTNMDLYHHCVDIEKQIIRICCRLSLTVSSISFGTQFMDYIQFYLFGKSFCSLQL